MTKITISILTEKETKEEFAKYAKEMGTNMSNLLNMFMKTAPRNKILSFYSPIEEVEPTKEENKIFEEFEEQIKNGTFEYDVYDEHFLDQFK